MTLSPTAPTHLGKELREFALRQLDSTPRAAAFIVAVERVAGAIEKRGIFP